MYCAKCGREISETAVKCGNCGTPVGGAKSFYAYDYLTREVDVKEAARVMDYYESLGWEIVDSREHSGFPGKCDLNFKRDRKIKNKDVLMRLQTKLDDTLEGVKVLEKRKKEAAFVVALIIGVLGALVFGIGMCMCMLGSAQNMMIGGSIVGVAGIAVCAVNYPIYKRIVAKTSAKVDPLIAKKQDEIASICEDAHNHIG